MRKQSLKLFQLLLMSVLFSPFAIFASTTNGIIDSTYRWAWGENVGWIDFGTSNGNVHVTDGGLSGYALSETIGWIYLDDVDNDSEGNLSGYAWSENAGWINFDPANGGVIIGSSGYFTGSALSETIGWIIFNGDYKVRTDWRPQSVRTESTSGGSGGSPTSKLPLPPKAPEGGFEVLINNNNKYTKDRNIVLNLFGGADVAKMEISTKPDLGDSTGIIAYSSGYEFDICKGKEECSDGEYSVYVKFYTKEDQPSPVVSDSIILDVKPPEVEVFGLKEYFYPDEDIFIFGRTESLTKLTLHWNNEYGLTEADNGGVWAVNLGELSAGNYLLKIAAKDLAGNTGNGEVELKVKERPVIIDSPEVPPIEPREPEIPPEIIVPEKPPEIMTVPESAPISMQGKWKLLAQGPINEFVLAPLPKNIRDLAAKFPELEKTFKEVGIAKITDVSKLRDIRLRVPTFSSLKGVPLAELSSESKQELPNNIVFAKSGDELIDFDIAFSVNERGESWQKINTVAGKPLQLAVKPDNPVKSVKSYVVFNSRKIAGGYKKPLTKLTASLVFANSLFTEKEEESIEVEEKLVLSQFEYTDDDDDGIYTAVIQAPVIEGEYEIITIMDYESIELGKKEIRLITIIDPEGYVFEKAGDKEVRIPDASVSIFWKNPETQKYELWPAGKYSQENPQKTDVTGKYSFLVPEGDYYLKVEAKGYSDYESQTFEVKEGRGVHFNVEMTGKYGWLKIFDWKVILLFVIFALLLYNFYKDSKKRKA